MTIPVFYVAIDLSRCAALPTSFGGKGEIGSKHGNPSGIRKLQSNLPWHEWHPDAGL
ncbi:MAG: hypothetical protein P8Y96_06225 [Desulfuromonadales bacterium]|jgi:hypothetical protein